ncbi:MAG TPA: hypothetical protein VJT81_06700 [Burkholderiales bacterium]|nr:hypothetical protein [Burkholderiales bacterium]
MKLPAFGKSLLAARQKDRHPEAIQVIYGEDWTPAREDVPLLAVKPEQFAPGIYDWRGVAGVPVEVHLRARPPSDWGRAGVCFLSAEIAEWSPFVEVYGNDGSCQDIRVLAFACRVAQRWPVWWSESLDFDYGRRQETYFTELTRPVAA